MDIPQLKCFLAVAREKSFTRAAKACHLAQPSLSYQISRLEEELGEALFLRKPRRVELSDSGRLLFESAVRIIDEQERVLAKFRDREALLEGELSFGIIPTMAPYLLPRLLGVFREMYPGIGVVARESRTSQLLREVVEGELEFAIVSDVEAASLKKYSLHLSPLFSETLLLAVPNAHRLRAVAALTPGSVDPRELILLGEGNCLRDQTLRLCQQQDRVNALSCEQLPTLLAMVAAGLGIAIVPEMAVKWIGGNEVSFLPFVEPSPQRMIGLLKKRGSKLGVAADAFVAELNKSLLSG